MPLAQELPGAHALRCSESYFGWVTNAGKGIPSQVPKRGPDGISRTVIAH